MINKAGFELFSANFLLFNGGVLKHVNVISSDELTLWLITVYALSF